MPRYSTTIRSTIAAAALGTLVACAGLKPRADPFVDALVLMESRQTQHYYDVALEMAAELIDRARTEEERCRITLAMAQARAGLGRYTQALEAFGLVQKECEKLPMVSAKGLFELGVLVAGTSTDPLEALSVFRTVITRFPDEPAAKRSVVWLKDIVEERIGASSAVSELREIYREVARSSVGPYLAFEAARVEESLGGDGPVRALSLYRLLIERHPDSSLVDDALFQSARICMDIGLAWDAVGFLNAIMARRETSLIFGSYDSAMYPKAAFLRAEAYYRATGDPEDAIRHYRRFISTYSESSKRDEAWFRIYEILEDGNRPDEAREVLVMLARDFPLSSKGRAAKRILNGGTR